MNLKLPIYYKKILILPPDLEKQKPLNIEKYMLPCFSKTLFGIECLGCGFQRGFLLLLQGQFQGAFEMYPAIYTSLLFLAILGLNFIDKNRNYKKIILSSAVINGIFMIGGYYFKHY